MIRTERNISGWAWPRPINNVEAINTQSLKANAVLVVPSFRNANYIDRTITAEFKQKI